MSVELKVPEMGESVSEIYIGKWYKSEGEEVDTDDPLVELESEKATLDLRAPAKGVLGKILKRTGETAEVGEVIGQLEDGATKRASEKPAKAKAEEPAKSEKQSPNKEKSSAATRDESTEKAKASDARDPSTARAEQSSSPPEAKRDEATEERAAPTPSTPQPKEKTESASKDAPPEAEPSQASSRKEPMKAAPDSVRREERVPISPVRRRIALRLVDAQRNAALLTTFNEIDMSAVKNLRHEFGEAFERRHHVRLGFMSFFVRAAIEALRDCPELNATIDENEIVYRHYHDIGVAISSDKGLVVPILRDADRMSFAKIELAIAEFANRAREGSLKVDDLQGGTFTITNGGVFGSLLSTPIVNPPQSGVLGMHAIQDRPVVVDGQIVVRPMMYVALTYDHRIVDGREAVTFLRRVKETIETPTRLLIEV